MDEHVDIVIVNYNTRSQLQRCIQSIEKYTRHPYRLIIIDNASSDGSHSYLKQLERKARVIYNRQNLGTSKAWNQGIRWGSGRYILMLNPDTQVTLGWLGKMIRCAESSREVAVVGAKQIDQYGKIIYAGVVEQNGKEVPRGRGEQDGPKKYNRPCECTTVSGSCYLIKRELLPRLGYFDERFFMYAEETDYSLRARLLGYKVIYCPVTIIHEREGVPMDQGKRNELRQKSDQLYREKWSGPMGLRFELARPEVLEKCRLVKGASSGVYILYRDRRHLIPSKDVFNRLGLHWHRVEVIPQRELEQIPRGITVYV